jgi:serine/threonine protein kinase
MHGGNARKRTLLLPGQSVATADADANGVVLAGGADWQCWTVAGGTRTVATASKLSFVSPPSSPARARYATVPGGRARAAGDDASGTAAREEREIAREIELDDIELGGLLGQGAYGTVHRGSWRRARGGDGSGDAEGEVVAVKTLHAVAGASERELRTFAREVSVLSRLNHPCVVRLLGACTRPPKVCIVEELMHGGSLYDRIHGHGGGGGEGKDSCSCRDSCSCHDGDGTRSDGRGRRLTFVETMRVAADVAAAMSYLAREKVVHRDLKSHNVLLTSTRAGGDAVRDHRTGRAGPERGGPGPERRGVWAKVADFGVARAKGTLATLQSTRGGATANGGGAGTPAYMAPELFRGVPSSGVDETCDVYSYGVVLWECATGRAPWAWLSNQMQIIFAVAVEGRRLPMPETRDGECLAGELTSLMVECWREESRDRPAFSHIEERVAAMRRRLSSL